MADTIVVVGNVVGDDYSSIASALAAIPTDLTITGGLHVIKVRNYQIHGSCKTPVITDDATHYIKIMAFEGDEVNGKGEGTTFYSTNKYAQPLYFRNAYDRAYGVKADLAAAGGACIHTSPSFGYSEVKDCFLKSQSSVLSLSNGYSGNIKVINTIGVSTGSSYSCFYGGNISGQLSLDRVTTIGGKDSVSIGTSIGGKLNSENTLSFNGAVEDFRYKSNVNIDWDYLASGDATASAQAGVSVAFDNRVITDDLEDPNAVTPDYNLKSSSTLKGSGSGGSDIGASLGAVTVIDKPINAIISSYRNRRF